MNGFIERQRTLRNRPVHGYALEGEQLAGPFALIQDATMTLATCIQRHGHQCRALDVIA